MLTRPFLSTDRIVSCLQTDYGIDVSSLSFIPLGADLNAAVYKAETYVNRTYFIKVKRSYNYAVNILVSKLLSENGIQQIILPIETFDGQPTKSIEDFVLIVYPFIVGEDGFQRDLTEIQWILLGKALKQIHSIEAPVSLQQQMRQEDYSDRWQLAVLQILSSFDKDSYKDEMQIKLARFLKENSASIQSLVDRAHEFGQKLKNQTQKFVLCHSDIHGGNVLIDENNSIYIVDWDEPIMAPKERDLMFIGGGVANVWNKLHEERYFYKGYGKTDVDRELLAYYRCVRILEDIAIYCEELLANKPGDRQKMYEQFTGMFYPQGVVEIALRS